MKKNYTKKLDLLKMKSKIDVIQRVNKKTQALNINQLKEPITVRTKILKVNI
jgi:hypothetical protein